MDRTALPHRRMSVSVVVGIIATALLLGAAPAQGQSHYQRPGTAQAAASAEVGTRAVDVRPLQPVPAPPRTGVEVMVEVGQDLAAVTAAHPAGTHFRIAAGVHRAQTLQLEDGDVVTGDDGAVLDGTIPLPAESFRRTGSAWVAGGRTEQVFTDTGRPDGLLHGEMVEGRARDAANHDLWVDGVRARHVATRGDVTGADTWFFDYDADEVVVGADPARHTIELATAWWAVRSSAHDVVLQHLTVRRYASPAQHGAIHVDGEGWTIRHVTVTENHGAGVKLGAHTALRDSRIIANGQIGVTAWQGAGIVVERNEIARNRTLGYNWGWEGGGTKLKETVGARFVDNWVHHNDGPGIWFDIDNVDAVISGNVVEENLWVGILYEISYGAVIADNTVRNNGAAAYGDLGAGVWVSNSSDVEVRDNVLYGNRIEVLASHDERGSGAHGRYETSGLQVHHNTMEISDKPVGLRVHTGERELYTSRGNAFYANRYHLVEGASEFWWDGERSADAWRALGFDTDGAFTRGPADRSLHSGFQSGPYGHLVG